MSDARALKRFAAAALCTICVGMLLQPAPSSATSGQDAVRVEILEARPENAQVQRNVPYDCMVTLSIEQADGTLLPSGWSTRVEHG